MLPKAVFAIAMQIHVRLSNFCSKAASGGARWCGGTGRPPKGSDTLTLALFLAFNFYRVKQLCSAVLRIVLSVRPSVCLSIRHTRALWRNERTYSWNFDTTWKGNQSSFLIPKEVGGRYPFPWNLRLKWPTPCENDDFDQYLLITSQP